MPIVQLKGNVERPKVAEGDSLIPAYQSILTAGSDAYIHLPCTPQPNSTTLGSGNTVYFDVERDEVKLINDICFRFTVSCSTADVQTLPPNLWLKRLVIESEKGSGDELIHLYPENWMIWEQITENETSREINKHYSNYHYTKQKSEGGERFWINDNTKFKVGETRDVYLKIPALFMHLNAIDMSHIRSDLRFRLEFSNDIVVDGDRANLSLDSLHLVIRNFAEENFDHNHRVEQQIKNNHKYYYLDCERLQVNDKTLTAGATTRIAVDQFTGKCPFLVVVIKNSNNPQASDKSQIDYVEIGQDGTFDITNPSSQSLLGQGTALKEDHLYQIFKQHTGNPHLKGVYLIPFCENVKKSMAGVVNGFMEFVGLKDYIELTFGNAPQSEVHTIVTAGDSTSGSYRYAFENGAISHQSLDYNADNSDITSALNAMPVLAERGITATVDSNLELANQSVTFSSNGGKVSDELGKLTIIGDGIQKVVSTTVSTVGKRGFTTGSDYQVEIFMYKFKCLKVDKNGRISCEDY